jgi:two-component system LytT family sensor kinase
MTFRPWQRNPMSYWGCQLFGWGGVALFGRIMEGLQGLASRQNSENQDHLFLPLTCLAGLIASHLLRKLIKRGEWLELPPQTLILRYAAALAISTLVLSVIGATFFKAPASSGKTTATFTVILMINSSLMGAWMAVYFLFHFYERLNRARQEQVLLREAVTLSQLESLRLQLNPHFLFNALNSIRALIPRESAEAREGVTLLADVLRSTLSTRGGKTVAFGEEMRLVRDYLSIEKLRFGDHLRIVEQLDATISKANIPPLMLLTVVENAIKHGAQSQEQAATITITGRVEEESIMLIVESPASCEKKKDSDSSFGIGLQNIRKRLRLIYGEQATAILETSADATTRCVLCYPLQTLSSPHERANY